MNFLLSILPYVDGNYLIAPNPVPKGQQRASDNGVMFTSEFLILLHLRGELETQTKMFFMEAINSCFLQPGLLSRAPGDKGQGPPDDYYGVAAMCSVLEEPKMCVDILNYGWKHWGSFNNEEPSKWTGRSFLWRQPQLLAAIYAGANKRIPIILSVYAGICILVSCIRTNPLETDPRRLSWLLIKALYKKSWFMRQCSKVWYKRLYNSYGTEGMRGVRMIYYKGENPEIGHPFAQYSRD